MEKRRTPTRSTKRSKPSTKPSAQKREPIGNFFELFSGSDSTRSGETSADATLRVHGMANLHAFLVRLKAEGQRTAPLDDCLNALTEYLDDGESDEPRVSLLVNADPILVPLRTAAMIGQIVSELVSGVRHDIGPKRRGIIEVECGADFDGTLVLKVGGTGRRDMDGVLRLHLGSAGDSSPGKGGRGRDNRSVARVPKSKKVGNLGPDLVRYDFMSRFGLDLRS